MMGAITTLYNFISLNHFMWIGTRNTRRNAEEKNNQHAQRVKKSLQMYLDAGDKEEKWKAITKRKKAARVKEREREIDENANDNNVNVSICRLCDRKSWPDRYRIINVSSQNRISFSIFFLCLCTLSRSLPLDMFVAFGVSYIYKQSSEFVVLYASLLPLIGSWRSHRTALGSWIAQKRRDVWFI